jgi:Thioredoxin like C-terminal domain
LIGEGGKELPAKTPPRVDRTPRARITPELYLGYLRASHYEGTTMMARDRAASYALPDSLPESSFAYGGRWRVEGERVIAAGRDASLLLRFRASKVHLVLGGRGRVEVDFRGRKRTVRVTRDRLYSLVALPRIGEGLLALRFTPGVRAYAFTFGSDVSEKSSALGRGRIPRALAPVGVSHRFLAPA